MKKGICGIQKRKKRQRSDESRIRYMDSISKAEMEESVSGLVKEGRKKRVEDEGFAEEMKVFFSFFMLWMAPSNSLLTALSSILSLIVDL